MFDDEEDLTDTQDDGSPFAVKPVSMGLDGMQALVDETSRVGRDYAVQIQKGYDDYAKMLREQRLGPSKRERIAEALIAFGQPTRSGRFGEALVNGASTFAQSARENRQAQMQREAEIAKLGFQKTQAMAELAQKYGLKGIGIRQDVLKAGMTTGRPKYAVTQDPILGTVVVTYGQGINPTKRVATQEDIATLPKADADTPDPTKIAGPTGGGGAASPGAVAPGAAPVAAVPSSGEHKLGESYIGADGAKYIWTYAGARKMEDPSVATQVDLAGRKKAVEEQATAEAKAQADKEKAALDIQPAILANTEAQNILRSGNVITGPGASLRVKALQAKALFGDAEAASKVAETQKYINATMRMVPLVLKAFGSGSGVSDKDAERANIIVGSSIDQQLAALDYTLDLSNRINALVVKAAAKPADLRAERDRRKRPPLSAFGN